MKELVMPKKVLKQIDNYVIRFLNKVETYAKFNINSYSGVFLIGPPGNGKTTFCKVLQDHYTDFTFFWVLAQAVSKPSDVSYIYEEARKYSPTIVLWEDAGPYVRNRSNGDVLRGSESILDEFLQQLCGPFNNSGVFTIMTSNMGSEEIDDAIKRPGRVGHIIEFPKPSDALVKQYIKRMILPVMNSATIDGDTEEIIDVVLESHKKSAYSFAQLNEIFDTSKKFAVDDDSIDVVGDNIIVRKKDIMLAIELMLQIGDKPIDERAGFRTRTNSDDYYDDDDDDDSGVYHSDLLDRMLRRR